MVTLITAVVLALVLGLGNVLLNLGLVRRLRELQARITGDDPADLWWPSAGTRIGDFRAVTVDGREIGRPDLAGPDVTVAFVSPTCPPCRDLADSLIADRPAGRVLAFVLSEDPGATMVTDLTAVADVCVVNPESEAVRAFGVDGYPTMLRITDGTVLAAGFRRDAVLPAVPVRAGR